MTTAFSDSLAEELTRLRLYGCLARIDEIRGEPWLERVMAIEREERRRRSLVHRTHFASVGAFKPLCDFDWTWPKLCDRGAVDALITLDFLKEAANVVFVGPNGVGKSMFAQNIAHQAVIDGHTVLFTSAGQLLGDLCALDSDSTLQRRLRHYARPQLLVIDEVGYLSYSNRHADMLFQLVSRRYQNKSTLITTNRPFGEWNEVFSNAACVVSLVDRLVHNAEIVAIEGESYRLKEARERAEARARKRRGRGTAPLEPWRHLARRLARRRRRRRSGERWGPVGGQLCLHLLGRGPRRLEVGVGCQPALEREGFDDPAAGVLVAAHDSSRPASRTVAEADTSAEDRPCSLA